VSTKGKESGMGVLPCGNAYCENVMCDRYSDEYGYICSDCFDTLVDLGPNTDIHQFMDRPRKHANNYDANLAYFNQIFPDRRDRD